MTTLDRAESDSLQAIVLLRIGDARRLVDIATDHLVLAIDTPSLRVLAGLDLARPVDPHDARDLFFDFIDELSLDRLPVEQAGLFASYAHARLITSQMLPARAATRLVAHLVVSLDYPAEPRQLMDLYDLDDMWDIGHQSEDQTRRDVLDAASSLVAEHEADHPHLSEPSLARIAKLVSQ